MLTAYPIFQPVGGRVLAEADRYDIPTPTSSSSSLNEDGPGRLLGRFKVFATLESDYSSDLKHFATPRPSKAKLPSLLPSVPEDRYYRTWSSAVSPARVTISDDHFNDTMAAVSQRPATSLATISNQLNSTESSPSQLNQTLPSAATSAMLELPSSSANAFPLRKVVSAPNLMNRFPASVFEAERIKPKLSPFMSCIENNSNKRPIGDSSDSSAGPSRTSSPMPGQLQSLATPHLITTPPSSDQLQFSPAPAAPPLPPKLHARGGWLSFLNYSAPPTATQTILRHDEPSLSKDLDKLAASSQRHCNLSRNLQVIREDAGLEAAAAAGAEPQFAHQRADIGDLRCVTPTQAGVLSSSPSRSSPIGGRSSALGGSVAGFLTHLTNRLGVTPSESNTFAPSDL